jgi:hypothetical protein
VNRLIDVNRASMLNAVVLSVFLYVLMSPLANATQPTGKISAVSFYGSGAGEVMFVIIEPKVSACPYAGAFVTSSQEKKGLTAALLSAFHTQTTVTIFGTGQCHSSWSNHEVLNYASFSK